MLTIDSQPVHTENVQGRVLENEAVVVLPEQGKIKVLNETGARIWSMADGRRSVREIAAQIAAEYSLLPADAEADTLEFIGELMAKGVLKLAEIH
jgi:hypothetical protein